MPRPLIVFALLFMLTGAVPMTAYAHAGYERSSPSPGQVLPSGPSLVEIFTSQDMRRQGTANSITVVDEAGRTVSTGEARIDDNNRRRLFVGLQPNLPNGRYVVRFQTLSDEDGEADSGAFAFYVGVQPTEAQRAQDAQLRLTSNNPDAGPGVGSAIPIVAAVVAALAVLVIVGSGLILLRRRT